MASSSSSSRKGRLGLLISVRYQNPIPPPPYPPKLIDIPTEIERYGSAEYNATISQGRSQDFFLDADGGMPVNLEMYDGMFEYKGDKSAWCPNLDHEESAQLDPEDAALLAKSTGNAVLGMGDLGTASVLGAAPGAARDMVTGTGRAEVSWLRRTQYLSSHSPIRFGVAPIAPGVPGSPGHDMGSEVDISKEAQIAMIEQSFTAASIPIGNLVHPTKTTTTAVETYPLLPDISVWGHPYRIMRMPENPSNRRDDQASEDHRPEHAIFHPVQVDGARYMSYYLPEDDEEISRLEQLRQETEEAIRSGSELPPTDDSDEKLLKYRWVRDYDYVKLADEIEDAEFMSEVFFTLRQGNSSADEPEQLVAFYNASEGRSQLKKRRVKHDGILSIQKASDHVDAYYVHPRTLVEEEAKHLQALSMEIMTVEDFTSASAAFGGTDDSTKDMDGKAEEDEEDGDMAMEETEE